MTQFSVRRFARLVSNNPGWCLIIATVLTALSAWSASRLSIEMDLSALLPEDSDVDQITQEAIQDFGSFEFMLVVVESREPGRERMLRDAADKLAEYLSDPSVTREVTKGLTPHTLNIETAEGKARAVALLTPADWESLQNRLTNPEEIREQLASLRSKLNAPFVKKSSQERLIQDPLNVYKVLSERVKIKSGPLKLNLRDNYFMSRDGQMVLLLMWPIEPATDLKFAQDFQTFLEETRRGAYIRNPEWGSPENPEDRLLDIYFYGPHYETISDTQVVKRDFYRTSVASFVAVICLFFFAFRRPEALFFVAVPLIISVVWTLGLTSILIGRLTQVTMAFSAILIGLGIDFSVHLYNRYLEEIRMGREGSDALRAAIVETGPGIIAGALTTAIAFVGLMTTSFVGFRELGLVAGLGILSSLAAVLLVLPPLLSLFGRGSMGAFTQRPMSTFGLKRFHYAVTTYPRLTLMAGFLVCGYLGYQARDVPFEDDFRYLKQPSDEYVELQERITSHFEVPANQLVAVVSGRTLQEALAENDQLYRNIYAAELSGYEMIAVDSLRFFVPSFKTQEIPLRLMSELDIESIRNNIAEEAKAYNLEPWIFDQFMTQLEEFQQASQQALQRDRMPIDLRAGDEANRKLDSISKSYIYHPTDSEYRVVTKMYPPPDSEHNWVSSVPDPFLNFLGTDLNQRPEVTGSVIVQEELRRVIVKDLARTVLLVLAAVLLYLMIYFESVWRAILSVIPVILAIMSMLGAIHLFDMKLHYLNIIALPMIVGIGVDSGIHLLQRYYEQDKRDLLLTVTRTGRAVVITTMTTMFGFGSLALANFRGIRELGIFSIIGVVFTLMASLLILPAALRLIDPQPGQERHGAGEDIG